MLRKLVRNIRLAALALPTLTDFLMNLAVLVIKRVLITSFMRDKWKWLFLAGMEHTVIDCVQNRVYCYQLCAEWSVLLSTVCRMECTVIDCVQNGVYCY